VRANGLLITQNRHLLEVGRRRFGSYPSWAGQTLRRQEQFRSALGSRDLIGQAKGILMERFDIDAIAAFELLRRLSQESNVKLVDVAEKLVKVDHPVEES
jgi:AmiR/NasT family two-component response regulator